MPYNTKLVRLVLSCAFAAFLISVPVQLAHAEELSAETPAQVSENSGQDNASADDAAACEDVSETPDVSAEEPVVVSEVAAASELESEDKNTVSDDVSAQDEVAPDELREPNEAASEDISADQYPENQKELPPAEATDTTEAAEQSAQDDALTETNDAELTDTAANQQQESPEGQAQISAEKVLAASPAVTNAAAKKATTKAAAKDYLDGVDVYSGEGRAGINIAKLAGDFVIVKVSEGVGYLNPYYKSQAKATVSSKKLLGLYHFLLEPTGSNGTIAEQADYFIANIKPYLGQAVLFLDWEDTSYSKIRSYGTDSAKQWLDRVYQQTGIKPLIYMSKSSTNAYNWTAVARDYGLWGAQYPDLKKHSGYEEEPWQSSQTWGAWGTKVTIHQYSESTTVAGCVDSKGNPFYLDVDKFFGTAADWKKLASGSGVSDLPKNGWYKEAGSYRYYSAGKLKKGWVVTKIAPTTAGTGTGLQRYWTGDDGNLVMSRLISESEAGWWAYARPEGYVVRGKYVAKSGNVYLADNDGKLESPGWHVTKAYDTKLQRYWIDESTHAAVPGYSKDGYYHYTLPKLGYVARGTFTDNKGKSGTANNDGLILKVSAGKTGWVVKKDSTGHLQRYWYRNGKMVKDELLTEAETGWWAYARPEGYVVRGRWKHPKTENVYLANNDGKLESPGWHVTRAYGQGLQRYYIEAKEHAAVPGFSSHGYNHVTRFDGPVVRGKYTALNGTVYLANNDGKLEMGGSGKGGWLVTNRYDGRMQRYYISAKTHGAIPGFFTVSGKRYYSIPKQGYVLRGTKTINGKRYTANNDGVLK